MFLIWITYVTSICNIDCIDHRVLFVWLFDPWFLDFLFQFSKTTDIWTVSLVCPLLTKKNLENCIEKVVNLCLKYVIPLLIL